MMDVTAVVFHFPPRELNYPKTRYPMGEKEDRWDHGTPIRLYQVEGGPLGRRGALFRRTGPRATRENRSWISGGSLPDWNAWSRWLRSGVPAVGDGHGEGHYVDRGQFGWEYRGFPRAYGCHMETSLSGTGL